MGKTIFPKYRIEIKDTRGIRLFTWDGKPTKIKLSKYIEGYAKSFEPGGVNYHITKALGVIPCPLEAKIVNQKTGEAIVTWKANTNGGGRRVNVGF